MALTELTTTIDCERETIDFDSIHEYLRESNLPTRDAAVSMSSNLFNQRQMNVEETPSEHEPPKTDELEALWPGVHHDFPQQGPSTKSASFYLSVGFAAGALLSIVGIFGYFSVSHLVTAKAAPAPNANQVLVAGVPTGPQGGTATASGDVLVPTTGSYQVQPGDTLAGIAVRNYKKVSPRLLDEICKANNMRNANVLSLGQKIVLPEYHASNQIAATTTSTMQ